MHIMCHIVGTVRKYWKLLGTLPRKTLMWHKCFSQNWFWWILNFFSITISSGSNSLTARLKAHKIAKQLVEEIISVFAPEGLLSDCGTNLLSHHMVDVCKLLTIKKLNRTARHPQCNGMIERFNRTHAKKTCSKIWNAVGYILPCMGCYGHIGIHLTLIPERTFILIAWFRLQAPSETATVLIRCQMKSQIIVKS